MLWFTMVLAGVVSVGHVFLLANKNTEGTATRNFTAMLVSATVAAAASVLFGGLP
jgi:uncharacterized membrane protein